MTAVYLEQGRTWTFACAVDWPGWARRAKGDEAALEELLSYVGRYALVVPGFSPGELHVVGTLPGTGTTDFGAPDARGPWDDEPQDEAACARLADLLVACWAAFDRAVADSPPELRKGPRGGGWDRDQVAAHVQEGERSYGRKLGVRVLPRTPWGEQREAFDATVRSGACAGSWPVRYADAASPGTSSTTPGRSRTSGPSEERAPARHRGPDGTRVRDAPDSVPPCASRRVRELRLDHQEVHARLAWRVRRQRPDDLAEGAATWSVRAQSTPVVAEPEFGNCRPSRSRGSSAHEPAHPVLRRWHVREPRNLGEGGVRGDQSIRAGRH